jgi:hypothetical protein
MRNRIKLLLIAMLSQLIGYTNTVQIISQRTSFEYSVDASIYNFESPTGLTISQIFSKNVADTGGLQTASGIVNNLPTGMKAGKYRVRVDLTSPLTLANGDVLSVGANYANILVQGGVIVESASYFEKSSLNRALIQGWIDDSLVSVNTEISNIKTAIFTLTTTTIPDWISTAKQEAITAAGQLATTAKAEAIADSKIYTDVEIGKLQNLPQTNTTFFRDVLFEPSQNDPNTPATVTELLKDNFAFDKLGFYFIDFTVKDGAGNLVLDKQTKVGFPTVANASVFEDHLITSNDKVLVEYYKRSDGTKDFKFVRVYNDYLYEALTGLNAKVDGNQEAWELAIEDTRLWAIAEIDARLGN